MKLNLNNIIKILSIILFCAVFFYIFFPKYYFLSSGRVFVIRCNKITGKMDYFDPFAEYERQHLTKITYTVEEPIDIANEAPVKTKSYLDIANEAPPKVK